MSLLQVSNLTKYFGGLVAVDNLSFHINKGEILGLIGPNGAGKTTVFNLITGIFTPTRGRIIFNNEDITGLRTNKIAGKGIIRTWQVSSLFANMTVLQNTIIGCHLQGKIGFWQAVFGGAFTRKREEVVQERAIELLDFVGLTPYKDMLIKHLPHGFLKRTGIAVALSAEPKLLLLDEPVSGMNPEEIREIMVLIKEVNKRGITILLVEHNMKAVMTISHRIVVLLYGKQIAEGLPQEIVQNQQVIQAYLGGAARVA